MKEKETYIVCPNCEKEFEKHFDFCPHCGQRNKKLELKLKYFLGDFISSTFNIDSKILLTLRLLIFYPGKLTKMFLSGKRASLVPPVRLYIVISLVYFTLLSLIGSDITQVRSGGKKNVKGDSLEVLSETDAGRLANSLQQGADSSQQLVLADDENMDAVITLDNLDQIFDEEEDSLSVEDAGKKSKWGKMLQSRLKKLSTDEGKHAFDELLRKYISIGMFVLMPITALIFKLLFYRRTYYIQHLVFVLHLQSMMYILFILLNLLGFIFSDAFVWVLNMLLFLFILSVWIKKYYEISWRKTFWKSLLFLILYGYSFGIFFIVVAVVSAWNL